MMLESEEKVASGKLIEPYLVLKLTFSMFPILYLYKRDDSLKINICNLNVVLSILFEVEECVSLYTYRNLITMIV